MPDAIARIAVSSVPYWVDRPYDYRVPDSLIAGCMPGVRVHVPFSSRNRRREGIVLALRDRSDCEPEKLKEVTEVLDSQPVLTQQQIQLALFMRERFFCTVYDAVRSMLPVGLWFDRNGHRRVQDRTIEIIRLLVSGEEASDMAAAMRKKTPAQARLLAELSPYGEMPLRELLMFTGCTRTTANKIVESGIAEMISREVFRIPSFTAGERRSMPVLNDEQQQAFDGLNELSCRDKTSVALLEGITGSGKTSVYIRLIDSVLRRGKSAVLLVPEIALTPQMLQTFSSYFGDDIAKLRHILRVIPGGVFRSVGVFLFLIDDEHAEILHRGKNSTSRADCHMGSAAFQTPPLIIAFPGGEAGMKHRNIIAEIG